MVIGYFGSFSLESQYLSSIFVIKLGQQKQYGSSNVVHKSINHVGTLENYGATLLRTAAGAFFSPPK